MVQSVCRAGAGGGNAESMFVEEGSHRINRALLSDGVQSSRAPALSWLCSGQAMVEVHQELWEICAWPSLVRRSAAR